MIPILEALKVAEKLNLDLVEIQPNVEPPVCKILDYGKYSNQTKFSIEKARGINYYSGWLVVEAEQDPIKANPFEYAKIGYKYLTETLKKSNIEIFKN